MNTHIVKPGEENLEQIASQYGLKAGDLAVYNRLPNNKIIPGQELKLELPSNALPIKVKLGVGDSLDTVAKQFNTSVERIKLLNNLKDDKVLEGTSIVAWNPFRYNYTKISKVEDIDTLAKQFNTTKDKIIEANPHIDTAKIMPNTFMHIPWQLNQYVEPVKETKISSLLKSPINIEPVVDPFKEKQEQILSKLDQYKDYYKFSTPKPKAEGLLYKISGISEILRDNDTEEYLKNITNELSTINNSMFKAFKVAEKEGKEEDQYKILSYMRNTNEEFRKLTGLQADTSIEDTVTKLMFPETERVKDYLTDQINRETIEKIKEVLPDAEDIGITDYASGQRYKTEITSNNIELINEGVEREFVSKTSDGSIILSDKINKYLNDSDAIESLSTALNATESFWEEFPKDFENCLLITDLNKRLEYQKEFSKKYSDLSIIQSMSPKFLSYNNLYLEDENLADKIDNIINKELVDIDNNDIIIQALTSGDPDKYRGILAENNIPDSDITKVGNLLDEYYNYETKRIALGQEIDVISNDLANNINSFQDVINNYDSRTNLQSFFIQGAQPTSKFGEALKGLALAKHQSLQARSALLDTNIDNQYISDFFSWVEKYNTNNANLENVIKLDVVFAEQANRLSERREERRLESIIPSNWFSDDFSDIRIWEKILVPLQEDIKFLSNSDNKLIADGSNKILKTLDYYMNDIVGKTIIPTALKMPTTYLSMMLYSYPEYLSLQIDKAMGNLTDHEYELKTKIWDDDLKMFAKLQFGIDNFHFTNASEIFNQLSTSNVITTINPIMVDVLDNNNQPIQDFVLDENGKKIVDDFGNPILTIRQKELTDEDGKVQTFTTYSQEITLWKDWNLFQVLKDGNRLDLYRDIEQLNPGKDLTKLKALDKVILPRIDIGMGGALIRGSENYIFNPQTFFEKTIINPAQVEAANQLVEIFYDPLTYVTVGVGGIAKAVVSPLTFFKKTEGKTLTASMKDLYIQSISSALTGGSKFTFLSRKIPQLSKFYFNLNKKIIASADKLFPNQATKWYHLPAKIDSTKAKFIASKSVPSDYYLLKKAIAFIDFFQKPLGLFRVAGKVSEEAVASRRIFNAKYVEKNLSDIDPKTIAIEKMTIDGVVIITNSNGKDFIGSVVRLPGKTDLAKKGKTVKKPNLMKSLDIQLGDGSIKTLNIGTIKEVKSIAGKDLKAMNSSWKGVNPIHSYISSFIEKNLHKMKRENVSVNSLKKGNYIVLKFKHEVKLIIGKVLERDNKNLKVQLKDGKTLTFLVDDVDKVVIIDPLEIKDLKLVWKDTFPSGLERNVLSPIKKGTTASMEWIDDKLNAFSAGQLLNRIPQKLRAAASNIINKAGFTLNTRAAIDTKLLFDYFARAFDDNLEILKTKVRVGDKYIDLEWNQRLDNNGKPVEVEGLSKREVVEYKIRSLMSSPESATLDDWKILCKYGVYPSKLKTAIESLAIKISRGDAVSDVLLKHGDFIYDLVEALDPNSFNPLLQKIKIRFDEEYNKYLIDNGIISREEANKYFEMANDYNDKIANIDDIDTINKAKEEIIKTYGVDNFPIIEGIVDIYHKITKDLLLKEKTILDPFYITVPKNINFWTEDVNVFLKTLDESVILKDLFFKREGYLAPIKEFKAGTKKSVILEALNREALLERFDYLQGEKVLNGVETKSIITTLYQDAIDNVKNPNIKEFYEEFLKTGEYLNLEDFISFIETYRRLKIVDNLSFRKIKDVINRQVKGLDKMDRLRIKVINYLDSNKAIFKHYYDVKDFEIRNTIDSILGGHNTPDAQLNTAAKTINSIFKNREDIAKKSKKFLIFDTETTGTSILNDKIIQIAWKVIDGTGDIIPGLEGNFYRAYDNNFNKELLEGDAQKIHRITNEVILEEGKEFKEILDNFITQFKNVDGIIAHNADFDIGILKKEFERNGISYDKVFYGKEFIDTMKVIDNKFGGKSLSAMYEEYIGGKFKAHNADEDVKALIEIYQKAFKEKKLDQFIFTDNTSSIYKNLKALRDQLKILEETKIISPALGVGEQVNYTAVVSKPEEELIEVRKDLTDHWLGVKYDDLIKASKEDIKFIVTKKQAETFDIVDSQKSFVARKNMMNSDKSILEIIYKYKKEIDKLSEEVKVLESKTKKTAKEVEKIKSINSKIEELKIKDDAGTLVEEDGIIPVHKDYGSTEDEMIRLKELADKGYRFLVVGIDFKRFGNKSIPVIQRLRKLGLVEEFDMTKPIAKGQNFDFYVLNLKSRKALPQELYLKYKDVFSKDEKVKNIINKYETYDEAISSAYNNLDYLTRIISNVKDSKRQNIISIHMSLLDSIKKDINKLDIDNTIGLGSRYADYLYKYISKHKNWFNNPENILNELKFIKDLNDSKLILSQNAKLSQYVLKALIDLKENKVGISFIVDENGKSIYNLTNLNKKGAKAKEMLEEIVNNLNLSDEEIILKLKEKFSKEIEEIKEVTKSSVSPLLTEEEYYKILKLEEWLKLPENKSHIERIDSSKEQKIDTKAINAYLKYKKSREEELRVMLDYDDYVYVESERKRISEKNIIGSEFEKDIATGGVTLKELDSDFLILDYINEQLEFFGYGYQSSLSIIKDLIDKIGAKKIKEKNAFGNEQSSWVLNMDKFYEDRIKRYGDLVLIPDKKERINAKGILLPGIYDDGIIIKSIDKNGRQVTKVNNVWNNSTDNQILWSLSTDNLLTKKIKDGDIIITSVDQEINYKNYLDSDPGEYTSSNSFDANNIIGEIQKSPKSHIKNLKNKLGLSIERIERRRLIAMRRDYLRKLRSGVNLKEDELTSIDLSTNKSRPIKYNVYKVVEKDDKYIFEKTYESLNDKELNKAVLKSVDTNKSYKIRDTVNYSKENYNKTFEGFKKSEGEVEWKTDPVPENLYSLAKKEIEKKPELIMKEFSLKNKDTISVKDLTTGKVVQDKGSNAIRFENLYNKDRASGILKEFIEPKELFKLEYINSDINVLRRLLRGDDRFINYIIVDIPSVEYIDSLTKSLSSIKNEIEYKKLYDKIARYKKGLKDVKKLEENIKNDISTIANISNVKVYKINTAENIVISNDLPNVKDIKEHYFNKEKGLIISDDFYNTKIFFKGKILTPSERQITDQINNIYKEVKAITGTEKGYGPKSLYSQQGELFTDTLPMDESIHKIVLKIENELSRERLRKRVLDMVMNTKRAWEGKEIIVIGLDNVKYVPSEFFEAVNDLKGKKCTFIFSNNPTNIELEMRSYIKDQKMKVLDKNLEEVSSAKKRKTLYKDSDIQKEQDELMKKASFVLLVGKIDNIEGVIPKPILIARAAKDAGILVYSNSMIIKDQLKLINSFFVDNIKEAYLLPGRPLKEELFNRVLTPQQALEKAIKASARKSLRLEWYKWKTEQVELYRAEIEDKFKALGKIGGETRDLTLATEALEEQVKRYEKAFKPIEDHLLKWTGKEDSLDKVLRLERKKLMKEFAYDLASGKKTWDDFDIYLKKGELPSTKYSIMKLGVKTDRLLRSLPGHLQGIFIMFVLRLSPRWYINNAIDDTIKTFLVERNYRAFLAALWLNTKVYSYYGSTIFKHLSSDTKINRIMIPFYKIQNKLKLIDAPTLKIKISDLKTKKDFDLVDWLSKNNTKEFSDFVNTNGDVVITTKKGNEINISEEERNYYLSAGIQEYFTDADEAMLAYKNIAPKNAWESIKKKIKEYNSNLNYFSAQSERMRRSFVLYRAFQNETIKKVEAKALIKDFFFDYRDVNRAVMVMRQFFPFFSFNYFTVKLFLKMLLGKYGYQTYRAGIALMEVWEANTQHLPEIYKDRISIKIGGKEYLIRPNISLIDVLKFLKDPVGSIEDMAENPFKIIFGLGYGPIVGNVVEELSGIDFYTPSRKKLREEGWNYYEIEKEIEKYEESQKDVDVWDKLYKLAYSIVPQIDILNNIFFKLDSGYEKTNNLLKSKNFREITKLFGLNIMEWDAVDKLQSKIFSLPPSIRNFYIDEIKKEDPELYKEFNRQALIGLWVKKVNSGASEQEILDALKERYTQNKYYELEEEEDGKGDEWLRINPSNKAVMEKVWANAETDTRKEYNAKVREIEADKRTITSIIEETIPSNLTSKENVLKYQMIGEDFTSTINRDILIKDLTNKGLTLKQMNTLIANKYPNTGIDLIRQSQIDSKKIETEEYQDLSLSEKKELKASDTIYYQKMKVINRFLPAEGSNEEESAKAFRRWEDAFDTYLTATEKQRYLDSLPDSQKILKLAMKDYISNWSDIINNIDSYNYYAIFNSQPNWFKEFYFIAHPDAKIYYPIATERERRLHEIALKMDKGIDTTKDRLALEEWFWNQTDAIKAWEKDKPETIQRLKDKKDYVINFQVPLQSFANINNWAGYYNFILASNNSKHLKTWSESGDLDRTPEQIKIDAEKKIQIAKKSKEFYSLKSTTWEDQKARQEWLEENSDLRDWWDRNKTSQEKELAKKVQEYQMMKFDFNPLKSDIDSFTQWRMLTLKREEFLKNNPEVLAFLNKGSAENVEPILIQKKLKIFNTLSNEMQAKYIDNNPDLSEYFLNGVPKEIRDVRELQNQYFDIKESNYKNKDSYYDARNSFLSEHPELKDYWNAISLPSSSFNNKELFNKYQNYLSKITKYFNSISSDGLNDFMRIGLISLNPYQVPGDSPEDEWLKGKVYSEAMQTWIRLLDENQSIGMYFFRQLPNWIRKQYYNNHPEKIPMANYSLGNWFGQSVWYNSQKSPNELWAFQQQKKYGSNMPLRIKERVEKILISTGQWEDRSKWTSQQWNDWQIARAARLNGLKSSDVATNPLIRKELLRASMMFGKIAPIAPGIYKKKVKWIPVPEILPADIISGNAMSLLESELPEMPSAYEKEEKPRNLQEQKVLDSKKL